MEPLLSRDLMENQVCYKAYRRPECQELLNQDNLQQPCAPETTISNPDSRQPRANVLETTIPKLPRLAQVSSRAANPSHPTPTSLVKLRHSSPQGQFTLGVCGRVVLMLGSRQLLFEKFKKSNTLWLRIWQLWKAEASSHLGQVLFISLSLSQT